MKIGNNGPIEKFYKFSYQINKIKKMAKKNQHNLSSNLSFVLKKLYVLYKNICLIKLDSILV